VTPWLTLSLQWLVGAVSLLLGLTALLVARRVGADAPTHRASWLLVGIALVMVSMVDVTQSTAAFAAVWAGVGSAIYEQYIRWAPALNYSRTGGEIALGGLLILVAYRGAGASRFRRESVAILLVGMLAGAALGVLEGAMVTRVHFSVGAFWNTVEMGVLACALVAALARSSMDWILWLIVTIKMISQAISTIWLIALAWVGVEGAWIPEPWLKQLFIVVVSSLMLGLALWRLTLARRGTSVPALLQLGGTPRFKSAVLP